MEKPTSFADQLKYWLPIILLIAGVVTSFSTMQAEVKALDLRVTRQDAQLEALSAERMELQVRLTRIETDIQYIRATLERQNEER